jgi:oligoribonuclease NrnB/cAMP/cGMP phosphodiesterase (DHH superfamily)
MQTYRTLHIDSWNQTGYIVYIYPDSYDIAEVKKNTMKRNEDLQVSVDSDKFVNSQQEKKILEKYAPR